MPPRRGARRGGQGGQGRGVGCVQPEMREQQQPAPPSPAPALIAFGGPHQGSDVVVFFGDHRYMKYPEDQKVQCAVFMLTDRGIAWWKTVERMLGGDVGQITWEQFMDSFYAKFFYASLRDAKWQEFLNLEQDDRTVEQYDAEFDMLSHFAPEMVATEAARVDKFVRGLRLDIQGLVRAL
ncbi:gag-protease polyprotein [Cucumis melo var. makuwa]|uniref:Gag-protease polyprotein n=1 Tax=Cucumis melo var. makuwa TaxID=1194695 RepID=A0A5A7T5T1_CUCMM|nr:gag-protease polyprotein [Cucumis melo var. makuwa]